VATTTPTTPSASAEFADRKRSIGQRVQHVLHAHPALSPTAILLIALLVFSVADSRFASSLTISLLVQQTAVVALLAVGQTVIILTAGIDLSVGAICIMATMIMATLATDHGLPAVLALLGGVLVGVVGGCINGALVTWLKLPPFIVTLGTLSVFTAFTLLYSGATAIQGAQLPPLLNWAGERVEVGPLDLTNGVLVVGVVYAVVGYALSQTAWGKHVYAVGDDPEAARLAGIRSDRVLLSVYAVAGLIYGIAAWVLIGRSGAASPNSLTDANLETITAVVIGGTSLFGGRGGVVGSLLGALIVGSFAIGLSLLGVDNQYRVLAVGLLVIAAVSVDQWIRKVRG
jgi:fructose transport system permease protein